VNLRGPHYGTHTLGYALGSTAKYLLLAPKVATRQQRYAMSAHSPHRLLQSVYLFAHRQGEVREYDA
jgi:hypothetical protein